MQTDNETIKCFNPFANGEITLRIKKVEIYKALLFLYLLTECNELENALTLGAHLLRHSNIIQHRRYYNLIDTIYKFSLDGLIEPKEFDIFSAYENVIEYVEKIKAKSPETIKVIRKNLSLENIASSQKGF
jgi:hypothetical protein